MESGSPPEAWDTKASEVERKEAPLSVKWQITAFSLLSLPGVGQAR